MGYIYKITNTMNGKAYVGQTYRTVQERFVEHLRMARKDRIRYKSLLYNAIKKYGEKATRLLIFRARTDCRISNIQPM